MVNLSILSCCSSLLVAFHYFVFFGLQSIGTIIHLLAGKVAAWLLHYREQHQCSCMLSQAKRLACRRLRVPLKGTLIWLLMVGFIIQAPVPVVTIFWCYLGYHCNGVRVLATTTTLIYLQYLHAFLTFFYFNKYLHFTYTNCTNFFPHYLHEGFFLTYKMN